jgi:DNA polymerase-3 subunit epsilon
LATAETVEPGFGPAPAATHEETELLLHWLATPGLRVVRGSWHAPLAGSARHLEPLVIAESARRDLLPATSQERRLG